MARPQIGDFGFFYTTGEKERLLGIVVGLNGDEAQSVQLHCFNATHPAVRADEFTPFDEDIDTQIQQKVIAEETQQLNLAPPAPPPSWDKDEGAKKPSTADKGKK